MAREGDIAARSSYLRSHHDAEGDELRAVGQVPDVRAAELTLTLTLTLTVGVQVRLPQRRLLALEHQHRGRVVHEARAVGSGFQRQPPDAVLPAQEPLAHPALVGCTRLQNSMPSVTCCYGTTEILGQNHF